MTGSPQPERSPAQKAVASLVALWGYLGAQRAIKECVAGLAPTERAALAARWSFWGRPKQVPPANEWRSFGFLTARAYGKTFALSQFVNQEVVAGRARHIGLAAQNEDRTIALQVLGPSGLIATAHPEFRPEWEATRKELVWPNGARAAVLTPEVPGEIRGGDYDLVWLSELQSWPPVHREEAFSNFGFATRRGAARTIWDATPKRRHPLLKILHERAARAPERHVIVRGTIHENAANLGADVIEDLERDYEGTQKGREELLGEMLDDSDGALVKQPWIDRARRQMPDRLVRRVVSIDPAVTNRRGSDTTGIVEVGLGVDGQAYPLGDASGKMDVGKWADIVLDWYVGHGCDLVIAETNKGGQLVVQNLRAAAAVRGLTVVVIGKDERAPQPIKGTVFVREVYARGAKEDRAEPVATAYERGRISHVIGADLASLEDTLTTWEPAPNADSPGDLDALTHACVELLDLNKNEPDGKVAFAGIAAFNRALHAPDEKPRPGVPTSFSVIAALRGTGDRI